MSPGVSLEKTGHYWIATSGALTVRLCPDLKYFDAYTLCRKYKRSFRVYTSTKAYRCLNLPRFGRKANMSTYRLHVHYLPHLTEWLSPVCYDEALDIVQELTHLKYDRSFI